MPCLPPSRRSRGPGTIRRCRFHRRTTTLIRHALLAATQPSGALGRRHRALARRIHQRETDYNLKFAHNPAIPFTNDSAEQEIRMTKDARVI